MLVELDLHEVFGIDLGDEQLMTSRTWRWLRWRIAGLLSTDCRLYRAKNPPPERSTSGA